MQHRTNSKTKITFRSLATTNQGWAMAIPVNCENQKLEYYTYLIAIKLAVLTVLKIFETIFKLHYRTVRTSKKSIIQTTLKQVIQHQRHEHIVRKTVSINSTYRSHGIDALCCTITANPTVGCWTNKISKIESKHKSGENLQLMRNFIADISAFTTTWYSDLYWKEKQ